MSNTYSSATYDTGIWGNPRLGIGAFYFSVESSGTTSDSGHIGSFYFGPIDQTIEVENILNISATLTEPTVTVTNAVSAVVVPNIFQIAFILNQPTVYTTQDFKVDFTGVPIAGTSPLEVEFTAFVNFSSEMKGKYKVKEYRWCFDYDYDTGTCNIAWVTTTQNPYIHTYTGYRGQKYSVKVCVVLESI